MKIKTSEATPIQLNWLVAKAMGLLAAGRVVVDFEYMSGESPVRWEPKLSTYYSSAYSPSTDWAHGGPIIEREMIELVPQSDSLWDAMYRDQHIPNDGPTPLIAAMRCYVAFELGDECDIPDELMKEDKPDWRDPNSGCYCVVCLAPVREDIFVQRGGCCPNHKFDDECTYR